MLGKARLAGPSTLHCALIRVLALWCNRQEYSPVWLFWVREPVQAGLDPLHRCQFWRCMSGSNDRPWLSSYPKGVPAEIDLDEFPSIVSLLETCFDRFRHRPAFTNFGKTISYGELDALSQQFANYLVNELKCSKGDRIAMMMPNVIQYPIAICGALRAGLVVVNTNPMYTARELKHQLVDSGAKVILVLDNFAQTVEHVYKETTVRHVLTTGLGDMLGFPKALITNFVVRHIKKLVPPFDIPSAVRFGDALQRGSGKAAPRPDVGAAISHSCNTRRDNRCRQRRHAYPPQHDRQHATGECLAGHGIDRGRGSHHTALPLYHIFALTANCLTFMKIGGHNYLITNPRDMPGFVAELVASVTPPLPRQYPVQWPANTPGFEKLDSPVCA